MLYCDECGLEAKLNVSLQLDEDDISILKLCLECTMSHTKYKIYQYITIEGLND